jgi:murein DD-endopeptidase MepM/ murein hydrolase activator NlpD
LKSKKTLSNWLTNRYLLIFRNEENFSEKTTFSFTYAKLIVFLLTLFSICMLFSLYLVKTILAQWFDPRHADMEINKKVIHLSFAVDSLAMEVDRKQQFIDNFQRIVKGEVFPIQEEGQQEELVKTDSGKPTEAEIASMGKEVGIYSLSPIDSQFRMEFEKSGVTLLGTKIDNSAELHEIYFFSPILGIVSSPYDPQVDHYGVDVVSKSNEPVKAVADGTVIFASWTQDSGYVIAIQHRSNLISMYKHNSALLKKVGSFVHAGEVISIIGNSGELTTGPHLHFELWYNGNPVNPEDFVSF